MADQAQAAPTPPAHHRHLALFVLAALAFIALALALLNNKSGLSRTDDPETENAFVDGDTTPLDAHVSGYVRALPVTDYQQVQAGATIAEIEEDDYSARVEEAAAQLKSAEAGRATLAAQAGALRQQVEQALTLKTVARADADRSTPELGRQRALIDTDAGTRRALEAAEADQKRAAAATVSAQASVEVRQRQLDVLEAQARQADAMVAARMADLDLARITDGWTHVKAPISGELSTRRVRVGDLLKPGAEIATVTPLDTVWVTANFTERQILNIRVGQHAQLHIDSFPDDTLDGHVVGISPLTGAQQAAIPADNTTGNYTKVVQRVSVKIAIDWSGSKLKGLVRPGMSATATVFTRASPS